LTERFPATWLDLREDVDHRSRAADLLPRLRSWWAASAGAAVLDLGCGTGSNLRYLAPELPGPQKWTLVDHDADLLALVEAPSPDVTLRPLQGDLFEAGLEQVSAAKLVTASALLDLVPESWLVALAHACAESGCAALLALTYDGTVEWPAGGDPYDSVVRDAVNEHQRRDKGLGAALGPRAGGVAEQLFRSHGYRTWLAPSPWRLGPGESSLARALVAGWVEAAVEQRPESADEVRLWAERRVADLARPDFGLVVGHVDLLAIPPAAARRRS